MALKPDKNGKYYDEGDDYYRSEPSIARSISFMLGMVMARMVADRVFNVRYLFHLKDPKLKKSLKTQKCPEKDYIRLDSISYRTFDYGPLKIGIYDKLADLLMPLEKNETACNLDGLYSEINNILDEFDSHFENQNALATDSNMMLLHYGTIIL